MRPAKPIRGVLFDYGLTLVTIERPQAALGEAYRWIAAYLAGRHGPAVPGGAQLLAAVHDRLEEAVAVHARGDDLEEIDLTAATTEAYREVGVPIAPHELETVTRREQEAWWRGIHLTPGALGVLAELRDRGLRIGLCSNAPYAVEGLRRQLDHLGLGQLLDSTTFSGEIGWRKPSRRLFDAALAALGTEAAETVMVGDGALTDVAGAAAAGMRTVRTREHRDDAAPGIEADAVIDRLVDLLPLLAIWTSPAGDGGTRMPTSPRPRIHSDSHERPRSDPRRSPRLRRLPEGEVRRTRDLPPSIGPAL